MALFSSRQQQSHEHGTKVGPKQDDAGTAGAPARCASVDDIALASLPPIVVVIIVLWEDGKTLF